MYEAKQDECPTHVQRKAAAPAKRLCENMARHGNPTRGKLSMAHHSQELRCHKDPQHHNADQAPKIIARVPSSVQSGAAEASGRHRVGNDGQCDVGDERRLHSII